LSFLRVRKSGFRTIICKLTRIFCYDSIMIQFFLFKYEEAQMVTTTGAFDSAWIGFSGKCIIAGGLTEEAKKRQDPLWATFALDFRSRFGCDVQQVSTLPKDTVIDGDLADKLSAWLVVAGESMGPGPFREYLRTLGLYDDGPVFEDSASD